MSTNDHTLTLALDAFCKRLVEGNEANPTGGSWDELTPAAKNYVREHHVGPLHAAAKVLTAPRVVTTTEDLDALPVGSVIRSDLSGVFEKQQLSDDYGTVWACAGDTHDYKTAEVVCDREEFAVLYEAAE